ncbi:MAG: hypothetical protein ORN29_02960 [Rhodoferax sp.]|nr:hypothetical protein [Rhodoferax sp.]
MEHRIHPKITNRGVLPRCNSGGSVLQASVLAALLCGSSASQALDFGPEGMFSLTGFAQATVTMQNNYCLNCQVADSTASKQIRLSDSIIPGKSHGTVTTTNWQTQPYLAAKYNLGQGYEISGLLSQRWRQGTVNGTDIETRYGGTVDVPDFWYEKNLALSHPDYGSVRIGAMTTRGWSVADYPYGGNLGVSDSWGASGAGYGMLGNAIRLGSRLLDIFEGDLYLELSYDRGNTNFQRLKPAFYELYAQYHKGDLVVDAMYQDTVNGSPGAWGHAPFSSVTPFSSDDSYVSAQGVRFSSNHQNIAMVMARYQVNAKVEVSGGIRHNQWSGNNSAFSDDTQQSAGFNLDFSPGLANSYTGYPAASVDVMLGARYRTARWTVLAGMVHLGTADTSNPSDRGQFNSATFNTLGVKYEYAPGLQLEATTGVVRYARQGLSPLSMPGNSSFSNVDSRISQDGTWLTLGITYGF